MSESVIECSGYSNISASTSIKKGFGKLMGIFVASASATPTIKVWDSTAGSGTIVVNTFTPTAGTFYPIPANFTLGCFVTLGGTVDCTVFYE